jgi:hypothetical protein
VISNSTLCAEGIFSEDIYVDQNVKVFDDTLFAVHLQRQYSASRELQEFLSTYASNKKGLRDTNAEKYYQALKVLVSIIFVASPCSHFKFDFSTAWS